MLRLQAPLPERYAAATDDELAAMIGAARAALGSRLFVLGHHYQRDDVMRWADARGDSFGLSRQAAGQTDAEFIVFCGVHFMAESADVLTGDHQQVLLPDLNAGCSMADMADIDQVEEAWDELARVIDVERLVPVTYMNSAAALKAFVGRHGGAVCTSSNAQAVLTWALERGDRAYPVAIVVRGNDRQGLLRDVSEALARQKTNVIAAKTQTRDDVASMHFTIEVQDIDQLQRALAAIEDVRGVLSSARR